MKLCARSRINQQYRMLLNRMEGGGSWYETQQGPFGGMPVAGDDMCLSFVWRMRFAECAVREAECCAVDKVEVYDTVPWRRMPLYSILFEVF